MHKLVFQKKYSIIQAVTHMMNCGENRFLDLNFVQQGQTIEAIVPNDSLRSIPGWYMLWTMVDDIPSIAKIVRLLPGWSIINGNSNLKNDAEIVIFPNPSGNGFLNFSIDINNSAKLNLELSDASDRLIRKYPFLERTTAENFFSSWMEFRRECIF